MTAPGNSDRDALDRLGEALVEDILAASDDAILAEARQDGEDPEAIAGAMRALFEKVVTADGKARMATAKAAVAADRRRSAAVISLKPEAARRLLNRALARDPEAASKLTMAARKGKTGELSDDEVRSLLEDFDELGALPTPDEPDGEV
jgi:hypothetical protein